MKRIFSCSMSQVAFEKWNKNDQKLFEAVEKRDLGKIAALLSKKPVRAFKPNPKGQSAFHLAAAKGFTECLSAVLSHGVEINAKNDQGCTALHLSASGCHPECVKLLLQHGANEESIDFHSRTALHSAASSGCVSSVLLLCDQEDITLDARDDDGRTPLMIAAQRNHPTICSLLLERGALVNIIDKEKKTALLLASEKGNVQAAETLLAHGADVTVKDNLGRNALYCANLSRDEALRKVLQSALDKRKLRGSETDQQLSRSQELIDVHAEAKVPVIFRHSTSYDHLALQQDEWRRRYEEEQKKVSHLQEELLRKSHEHEVFAEGCRTEKDRLKARICDISDILHGKMNDMTGRRKELIFPLSQPYDQPHFLDLLAEQVQTMKGKNDEMEKLLQEETMNMAKKEKLAEELQQLEKNHQEEMERLQHQVITTVEEKVSAMKRVGEIEGHLENMRSVLSQFENRKRVHSNMMDDLNEHVFEMTCENERLRELVKTLQECAGQEDKTSETNLANRCKNAQNVLNNTVQELKRLLLQIRMESANAQKEKQAILNENKSKNLEDPAQKLQQGLESAQPLERCEASWNKTLSSLEHILSNLENSKTLLLDPTTHQRPTYPLKNTGYQEVGEAEVFVNGSTSAQQEGYTMCKESSNAYLEQNQQVQIREHKRSSRNEGMSPVHVQSSQVEAFSQEKHNAERDPFLDGTLRHQNFILAIDSVEMQEALSRVVELEKEVSVLTLENAGLLKELDDAGEEKVKLQGELQALRNSLQTDFIPMQDVQGRVGELEQNFLLLTDELSTEQERTKKLTLQLESQRSEMHQLRDSFPPEIIQAEKSNDGRTFSTDILEEWFWNVGTLVKKHNELRQQKLKLEQENQELKDDQTPYIPITLHNEKVTLLTQKIDQQTAVIADLEHKLSRPNKAVEELDGMTHKAEAQAKEIKQLEEKLSDAIGKLEDLTSKTDKIDSQDTEAEGHELKLSSTTMAVRDLTTMTCKMDEQALEIQELKAGLSNATKAVKDVSSWKRKMETQAAEIRELEHKLSIAMKAAEELMAMTHIMDEQAVEIKNLKNKLSGELANATKAAEDFTSMTNLLEAQASEIQEIENKLSSAAKTAEDLASVTHKMEEQAIEIQELKHKLSIATKAAEEVLSIANKIEAQTKEVRDIEHKLSKALKAVENLTLTAHKMDIQATEVEDLRQKLSKATKAAENFTTMTHKMQTQTAEKRELEQTLSSAIRAVEDSTSMAHKIDLQAKEIEELQHKLSSATKNFENLQKELMTEKEKSVNKGEHLRIVSALEKHIADSKAELELEKMRLAGKCKEVKVLNDQLDQVSAEAEKIKNRKKSCLQDHKKVKSTLELKIQALKDELKDMSEKMDQAVGPDAHKEKEGATKIGADQNKPSKMTILQEESAVHWVKSEASQDPTNHLLEKVSQLSCMCEGKGKKIAQVLGGLKMFSKEMVHLQSTHDQLQQQLKEAQKQHQKTISIYRTHLLYAAQGFMDEEVHMSLQRIQKMQESVVC